MNEEALHLGTPLCREDKERVALILELTRRLDLIQQLMATADDMRPLQPRVCVIGAVVSDTACA